MGIFRHRHTARHSDTHDVSHAKKRRGDTLIEVTLAIAIFSAVSVLTIGAMNGSVSQAQAALEVTLARSEIDAQAEALRFIHNSYVSDKSSNDGVAYNTLWKKITSYAINYGQNGAPSIPDVAVSSCNKLYSTTDSANIYSHNAFIINTRRLSRFSSNSSESALANVIVPAKNNNKFYAATLYPRIIYNNGSNEDDLTENDSSTSYYNNVARVEGLYTIASAANDKTFYDFYIYSCWYSPNAEHPTTIGTVIRLYNPEVVSL